MALSLSLLSLSVYHTLCVIQSVRVFISTVNFYPHGNMIIFGDPKPLRIVI